MDTSWWLREAEGMLLAIFTVYLFFLYFSTFFSTKKYKLTKLMGIILVVAWQFDIWKYLKKYPSSLTLCVTVAVTILAVVVIYEGKIWMKCFFSITFVAIWMLSEVLIGNLFLIFGFNIEKMQMQGSVISKAFVCLLVYVLKKVFTNEKFKELPLKHSTLLILIPIGSMYIINDVFILSYSTNWIDADIHSLAVTMILLIINILIFYIYFKLAEDLHIRQINIIYEQQLDLCERHQKEAEHSILQMRDVRHSMKNYFLTIMAYAEREDCSSIISYVRDIMEAGNLHLTNALNTGNIVADSLVGYWKIIAEENGIEFQADIDIPMEVPFRGADISLILGNLMENAVEGAINAKGKKYIRLQLKYDRMNLLIVVQNTYCGELIKGKGGILLTTKQDISNHGIGISSVKRAAEKYHGTVNVDSSVPNKFIIRVVLYSV